MRAEDVDQGQVVYMFARSVSGKKRYICVKPASPDSVGRFLFVNSRKARSHAGDFHVQSTRLGIGDDPTAVSVVSCTYLSPVTHAWLSDPFNEAVMLTMLPPDVAEEMLHFCGGERLSLSKPDREMLLDALRNIAIRNPPMGIAAE